MSVIDQIENLVQQAVNNFQMPDKVWLSSDVYIQLMKEMQIATRYNSNSSTQASIRCIMTCAGPLEVNIQPATSGIVFVGENYIMYLLNMLGVKY